MNFLKHFGILYFHPLILLNTKQQNFVSKREVDQGRNLSFAKFDKQSYRSLWITVREELAFSKFDFDTLAKNEWMKNSGIITNLTCEWGEGIWVLSL